VCGETEGSLGGNRGSAQPRRIKEGAGFGWPARWGRKLKPNQSGELGRSNGGDVAIHAVGIEPTLGRARGVVGVNDGKDLGSGSGVGKASEGFVRWSGAGGSEERAFGSGSVFGCGDGAAIVRRNIEVVSGDDGGGNIRGALLNRDEANGSGVKALDG